MNRLLQLKQQRAEAAGKAKAINLAAAEQNRNLTAEEGVAFDGYMTEIDGYNRTIRALEQEAGIDGSIETRRRQVQDQTGIDVDEQREAFRALIRFGGENLTPEARATLTAGSFTSPDFRIQPPQQGQFRSVQSELTGNLGGYIVPQGFWAQVITAMKYYAGMLESGPTIIDTSMGNDLPIPLSNDTSNIGRELAESSPVTQTAIPFGQVIMKAFKYSSDMVLIPIELLQDSGVDIEAYVVKMLAIRIGRILNLRFTTGDGNSRPRGIMLDAVQGVVGGTGQATSILYDDVIDLKYSVNKAYRSEAKWMCSDDMLRVILKLKDKNDRPLILDYLNTLQANEPERLLGQPIIINNDMASPGANNKTLLYGAFANYWVRRVMNLLMMRLTERFADAGQVAFLAFMRADGRMVNAGTDPIKYYQHSA